MKQSERGGRGAAFQVTSAIPGRIRLRFAEPDAPVREVAARVRVLPGVLDVSMPSGTMSLVIRCDPQRDLEELVGDVEGAAAAAVERHEAHEETRRKPRPDPLVPRNGVPGPISRRAGRVIEVLHQMPGRMRLRIHGLRLRQDIAARFEHDLSTELNIRNVDVQARDEFVIVRYDENALTPADVVRTVARVYERDRSRKQPDDEFHCAADLKPRESPKINPLLLPTVAYGLAAVEAAPVVAGGALALAALPTLMRAGQSLRRACLATDQFDVVSLGLLAAQGNFLTASIMTWFLALNDLTRRNAREEVRRTVTMWQSGQQREHPGKEIADILETAPVSNMHVHTDALQGAGKFAAPLIGVAVTDYLMNRDLSRVIGILKPRCEFESGLQFVVPATTLTAMTSAAENGVLFTSAKSLERLAHVDTVLLELSNRSDRAALVEHLRERDIDVPEVDDREEALARLQMRGRSVALVTDDEALLLQEPRADVNLFVPRGEPKVVEGADALLADADLTRVVFAFDAARMSADSARHNVRLLTGAAVLNVTSTLFGASSAALSTVVNAGTTITAAMNALRTKPVPQGANRVRPRLALEAA